MRRVELIALILLGLALIAEIGNAMMGGIPHGSIAFTYVIIACVVLKKSERSVLPTLHARRSPRG